MMAANFGRIKIVKLLLEAGADVNFRNRDNETALIAAAQGGSIEATRLLIEAGADINGKNSTGETALMKAS